MNNIIYDNCIIGAGASGLVAAIESSRRGLSSVVVDKNKKPGMKLYATGNGRCNITNDDWEEDTYYENDFVDQVFEYLYRQSGLRQRSFVLDYFKKLGIEATNKNGYFYPSSMQSSSVVWALIDAAAYYGAMLLDRSTVITVEKVNVYDILDDFSSSIDKYLDNNFVYKINYITRQYEEDIPGFIYARNIILATGGLSQPKLGAPDKDTYENLLNSLHIPFAEFRSALCPVILNDDISMLSGVRTRARIKANGHSEVGELQITDDGISGIVTFNMSYYMSPGDIIEINVLPKVSEDEFAERFNAVKNTYPDKRLDLFLNGYINDKLAVYMIKKFYGKTDMLMYLKDVTETGIRGLYQELTEWKLYVRNKAGFDQSQASAGGIMTHYIDPYTMMIAPDRTLGAGIYATGEATNVIGKCGGYNLTYAFVTGYIAGNSVK